MEGFLSEVGDSRGLLYWPEELDAARGLQGRRLPDPCRGLTLAQPFCSPGNTTRRTEASSPLTAPGHRVPLTLSPESRSNLLLRRAYTLGVLQSSAPSDPLPSRSHASKLSLKTTTPGGAPPSLLHKHDSRSEDPGPGKPRSRTAFPLRSQPQCWFPERWLHDPCGRSGHVV